MLHRLANRAAFWGTLAILATICGVTSLGGEAAHVIAPVRELALDTGLTGTLASLTSWGLAAPLLSAVALLIAVTGWQAMHRQGARASTGPYAARRARDDRAAQLQQAMMASTDGMFLMKAVRNALGEIVDFEVTDANPTGLRLVRSYRGALVGSRLREQVGTLLTEDGLREYAAAVTYGTPLHAEIRVDRRRFDASWLLQQAVPIPDGLVVTLRDISATKREEARLRRASITDELTGLYNRRGFLALAEQQTRIARRQEKDFALLYVDMDEFKALNDEFGHGEGDRALTAVGRLLRRAVRDCDLVARMGGDEFTIMALDADGNAARLIQRRIEQRVAALNASGELRTAIALTIGYTRVRPTDTAPLAELLARADALLYSRKRRRKAAAATDGSRAVRPAARARATRLPADPRLRAPEIPVLTGAAAFA